MRAGPRDTQSVRGEGKGETGRERGREGGGGGEEKEGTPFPVLKSNHTICRQNFRPEH